MKYAYPGGVGSVLVDVRARGDDFILTVSDEGRGLPASFNIRDAGRRSLGMRMVDSLSRQLRGKIAISTDTGTEFRIIAPVD